MTRRFRGVTHSVLFRYMVSYTMIMVVLMVGTGVFMNENYSRSIKKSAVDTQINKLDKIRAENERMFDAMLGIASQIGLSPYIKPFRFDEEPEQAYHLKKQLIPYAVTNSFFDQMYLWFYEDDYIYSSFTSMPLSLFLNDMMRFESVAPDDMAALLRAGAVMQALPCQRVNSVLLDGSDAPMVTVAAAIGAGASGGSQASGCLVFMIKESTYHELFKDAIYEARNTYIFYDDALLVAQTPLAADTGAVRTAVWAAQGASFSHEVSLDGKGYLLVGLKGQKHRMRYVSLLPLEAVRADILTAQWTGALTLLGLAIPCMLLIYTLSKRHVRPIVEISRHFAGAGSDEISTIKTGIKDLHAQITGSLPAMRSSFILSLIKGRYHTRQEIVAQAKALLLDIDKRFYMALLLSVAVGEKGLDIESLLPKNAAVTGYGAELISREQFFLLLFSDTEHDLIQWAETLQGEEERVLALSTSEVYGDFACLGAAYLEASARFDHLANKDDPHARRFDILRSGMEDVPEDSRDIGSRAGNNPVIAKAIAYMDENAFDPNLSMSAVADALDMSAVRLSLDFKEFTGMSPSEYLLRMRMEKAQMLLIQTDQSIKDICAAVGYYDTSSFIRRFKRYMGSTPMQYRQSRKVSVL